MVRGPRFGPGGIPGLVAVLQDHCEAVEYDLLALGLDLRDVFTGSMSWRRLGVVIANLPGESATKTAMRDALTDEEIAALPLPNGHGAWSRTDMLLAWVGDQIRYLIWMQSTGETPPPEMYPRPGVTRRKPHAPPPEIAAYLEEVRRLNGEAPTADWRPEIPGPRRAT